VVVEVNPLYYTRQKGGQLSCEGRPTGEGVSQCLKRPKVSKILVNRELGWLSATIVEKRKQLKSGGGGERKRVDHSKACVKGLNSACWKVTNRSQPTRHGRANMNREERCRTKGWTLDKAQQQA